MTTRLPGFHIVAHGDRSESVRHPHRYGASDDAGHHQSRDTPTRSRMVHVVELSGVAQAFQDFMRELARQDVAGRPG
jgi:hypothetical protein